MQDFVILNNLGVILGLPIDFLWCFKIKVVSLHTERKYYPKMQ